MTTHGLQGEKRPCSPLRSAADFTIAIRKREPTPRFKEWRSSGESSPESIFSESKSSDDLLTIAREHSPIKNTGELPNTNWESDYPDSALSLAAYNDAVSASDSAPRESSSVRCESWGITFDRKSNEAEDAILKDPANQQSNYPSSMTESSSISSYARDNHRPSPDLRMLRPARILRNSKLFGGGKINIASPMVVDLEPAFITQQNISESERASLYYQQPVYMQHNSDFSPRRVSAGSIQPVALKSRVSLPDLNKAQKRSSPVAFSNTPAAEKTETGTTSQHVRFHDKFSRSYEWGLFGRPRSLRSSSHEDPEKKKQTTKNDNQKHNILIKQTNRSPLGASGSSSHKAVKPKSSDQDKKKKKRFFFGRKLAASTSTDSEKSIKLDDDCPRRCKKLLLAPTSMLPLPGYEPIHFLETEARKVQTPRTSPQGIGRSYFYFDFHPPGMENADSDKDRTPSALHDHKDYQELAKTSSKSKQHSAKKGSSKGVDWYRVRSDGETRTAGALTDELAIGKFEWDVPEHLPSSPLCPLHPKHPSGGKGICVYHGRRKSRMNEEEAEVPTRKSTVSAKSARSKYIYGLDGFFVTVGNI